MNTVNKKKTVLVMAGGTGGHVFPALSIASYLQDCGVSIEWLGTKNGLESTLVPNTGIKLNLVNIGGLRGKSIWQKVLSPIRIVRAIAQSFKHIKRIQPDCVLGLGGFVTGPGGVAAWMCRTPLVIHEQNAIAGFTNMMLLPFSKIVMQAFPKSFDRKKNLGSSVLSKLVWKEGRVIETVGNPLREEIVALRNKSEKLNEDKRLRVLIVGGSLGAVAINEVIPQVISSLDAKNSLDFWHQCGSNNLDETLSFYQANGLEVNGRENENGRDQTIKVTPFIADMAEAYQWSDLVICRSGALTVSEVAAVGVASILIPYPSAVDDHQTENARILVEQGAAKLLPQNELNEESLLSVIHELILDREQVKKMAKQAGGVGVIDSSSQAGLLCLGACND